MSSPPTSQLQASGSTSVSLLARARRKDPEAWQRMAAVYGPVVYSWARQAGLQSSDASDVMQEVFRAVARSFDSFRRENANDSFRGWLWTITKNKTRDHFRRQAQRPERPGPIDNDALLAQIPDAPPDGESSAQPQQVMTRLARHVLQSVQAEFEPSTWQAFWRTAIEDQSPADVASALSISVGAVYMAKSRVLRRLRAELAGLNEGEPSP
jgi:RNA polymerase sigma-70 factor (ECF subfamily)